MTNPANPNLLSSRTIYVRMLRYLGPYRGAFGLALVFMVLFGATDGGVPFLVKYILDGIFSSRNSQLLYLMPALLVGFAIFRGFCDFWQQYLIRKIGHEIVRDIRNDIHATLLKQNPGYFIAESSANLVSHMTSDVVMVRMLMTEAIASILRDSIRIIALTAAALYLDWRLALIAVTVFPIGVLPVMQIGRRMRKLSRRGQDAIGSLSGLMQEAIIGNRVVKGFNREDYEQQRFRSENDRLSRTFIKSERVRALTGPINEVLASLAVAGVILYGGVSVLNGTRTQGDFIAFLISVFLMYDPFKKLSNLHSSVQQGLGGAERILEILDSKPKILSPQNPRPLGPSNRIDIVNLWFSYHSEAAPVLRDISVSIEPGQKVALVGFSGSGKSTLVDLIPRFIDPQQGSVSLGGVDVRTVALEQLRSRIGMVGQNTFLFNDSVFNNIAYGKPSATREEVEQAARAACAHDFITQLPNGYDTVVGEAGLALSGGERQRLSIARAILKDAPILILDEATASLDNRSEREVQVALDALERGRTTLVIAHRLSTVRSANCIHVMRDGRIVESGTHDQLITKDGEYARLHELQFQDTETPLHRGKGLAIN